MATHVVIQGIDLRRREVYEQIVSHGQAKPYDKYNVQAAVKDALYYHGLCSVMAGIEFASDTIEVFDDPGINVANRVLAKLKTTDRLLNDRDLDSSEAIKLINTTDQLLSAGTTLGEVKPTVSDPLDQLGTTLKAIGELDVAFSQAVGEQKPPLTADEIKKLDMARSAAQQRASTMLEMCRKPAAEASRALALARVELKQAELPLAISTSAVATAVETARSKFELQEAENQAGKIASAVQQVRSLLSAYLDAATGSLQTSPRDIEKAVKAIEAMKDEKEVCQDA